MQPVAAPQSSTRPEGPSVDTSATQSLVQVGLQEALALHESELASLTEQIRTGAYSADPDILASRVAEVLGL
jgi:hypothetical protein